jgi:polygalacturonase
VRVRHVKKLVSARARVFESCSLIGKNTLESSLRGTRRESGRGCCVTVRTSLQLEGVRVTQKQRVLAGLAVLASLLGATGCNGQVTSTLPSPVCGNTSTAAALTAPGACGADDPNLPPEPKLPTDSQICQTLTSNKSSPDEGNLDTNTIQAALNACKGQGAVRLVSSGANNVFVSGSLIVNGTILWIDVGTILYASRNPTLYQSSGNCGLIGVSDSNACLPLLQVTGVSPGVVGDGVIDGQGGEPIVNQAYSWWDISNALRTSNGSGPNPALIEVKKAQGFLMYRITLHNSPKFHVKLSATPPLSTPVDDAGVPLCATPGQGFIVWGVTILTPSVVQTSTGFRPTPYYTRNTDGIDPGEFALTSCGVIACSTISTGDDMVALKAAHGLHDVVIAHDHFGTGHGMSLGSETNLGATRVNIYDLTIDGDSRWTGAPSTDTGDFNGIRVKSDESRGGLVDQISFSDICVRDVLNPIVIDSSYNPLYGNMSTAPGTVAVSTYPIFKSISLTNVRDVMCKALAPGLVIIQGFNDTYPAGPIKLDNVIVDGISPLDVSAQYTDVMMGPGNVNFMPQGTRVNILSNTIVPPESGGAPPKSCSFPALPVAQ